MKLHTDLVHEMYYDNSMSSSMIAEKFDCSESKILRFMTKHGMKRRNQSDASKIRCINKPRKTINIDLNLLLIDYNNPKLSIHDITEKYNCSRTQIYNCLKGHTHIRRRYTLTDYNVEFFKTWSHELAWTAGIILTDGHLYIRDGVAQNIVMLSMCDRDVVEKVARFSGQNINIGIRKKQYPHNTIHRINICNSKIVDFFIDTGIHAIKMGENVDPIIPPEFMSSFIRGCIDGDGCISARNGKDGIKLLHSSYVSANEHFAEYLKTYMENVLGLPKHKLYKCNNSFTLNYGSKDSKTLMKFLYSDDGPRMDRKHNRYLELS